MRLVSYLSVVNKRHSKPEIFSQLSAHQHLPYICFLTLARFTFLNDQLLQPHLYMYLPSCYVFARWACVSLYVSEELLSLASGQPGFPALQQQEQSETGNAAGCCYRLGGRKVKGSVYLLITPTSSGLCLVTLHLSMPLSTTNLWIIELIKFPFYVFSICWSSAEHLTSMLFIVFTLLWTLCRWASTEWCNSYARYPHAQCSCHSCETEPSPSRAWNERSFIKALSWDHLLYLLLCRSILGNHPH